MEDFTPVALWYSYDFMYLPCLKAGCRWCPTLLLSIFCEYSLLLAINYYEFFVFNIFSTKSEFMINQFEMDFSYAHKSHFSVGAATAYNNETQNMQLAMAFIHYSFEKIN